MNLGNKNDYVSLADLQLDPVFVFFSHDQTEIN